VVGACVVVGAAVVVGARVVVVGKSVVVGAYVGVGKTVVGVEVVVSVAVVGAAVLAGSTVVATIEVGTVESNTFGIGVSVVCIPKKMPAFVPSGQAVVSTLGELVVVYVLISVEGSCVVGAIVS
jgi:hypothetical protein